MCAARKSYHHGDLRDALLEAAEEQLRKSGRAGLSLRKLGRALGVTPGAPYRHFEDKDALLAALCALGFRRLTATMADAQEGCTDSEDRLRRGGIGYITFAWTHPALFRLMFGWMPSKNVPELSESGQAAFKGLLDILEACDRDGLLSKSIEDSVLLTWSAVHGAAFLMIDGGLGFFSPVPDPRLLGTRVHNTLWSGNSK